MSDFLRYLLTLALIVAAFMGFRRFQAYYRAVESRTASNETASASVSASLPASLPGLPQELEPSLEVVTRQGASSLKKWIDYYRPRLADPRLAWIELDYVMMVSRENPAEARQVFLSVKERISSQSPVYPRIKQLSKTFE